MPLESPKPPDPILKEFCTLTGMCSEGLYHKLIVPGDGDILPKSRGRPKGAKNRPKGIKVRVKSPGSASAGAGSILKRLRNSKVEGKGRSRCLSSPSEECKGKRSSNPLPVDEVLSKVLDRMAYDKGIASQMVFKEGVKVSMVQPSNKLQGSSFCSIEGNDGSFIKNPIEPCVSVSKSHSNGLGNKGDVVNGSVDPGSGSNGSIELNMADVEHVEADSTKKADKGIDESVNGGSTFVFGNVQNGKGILKKPTVGLTSVQFGPSLFYKSNSVWSSKLGAKNGCSDVPVNIESFAEKMKKGVEDRELQMNFTPQSVSKNSDGSRRIAISIFSGIGKPMIMDRLTKERCLKKSSKLDFARVLVEVNADEDLPSSLEIEYPQIGMRPARIGKLDVKYQWKPPLCTHCKSFGHTTVSCKVRPRKEEEIAAKVIFEALKSKDSVPSKSSDGKLENDGLLKLNRSGYQKSQGVVSKVKTGGGSSNNFQQGNSGMKAGLNNSTSKKNAKPVSSSDDTGIVQKPPLSSKYNANFKPRVLVRGSGSDGNRDEIISENIPVNNSYQVFEDHDMVDKDEEFLGVVDEEYDKVVWPKLKLEVVNVLKSGVYPSLAIRSDWSPTQLEFFYKNCSKFGMERFVDDEEVDYENEGMANVMKPEKMDEGCRGVVNDGPPNKPVSNES
ncbi:hypothetical protein CTI12_AA325620 [Artemisia annua]|uniref:DUF4283 domain-containing protein n=1 Tax=Artemisia annua TaxID=35608 RepID=A0A2U1MZC7_ARTAN|nr:hypothetical protein CTI12_AA325620 [Artemisia annua]